jgi:hypothetical protein
LGVSAASPTHSFRRLCAPVTARAILGAIVPAFGHGCEMYLARFVLSRLVLSVFCFRGLVDEESGQFVIVAMRPAARSAPANIESQPSFVIKK